MDREVSFLVEQVELVMPNNNQAIDEPCETYHCLSIAKLLATTSIF
jgi:hypothetical protein